MLMIRPVQRLAQVVGEDLHVAGEHHQLDMLGARPAPAAPPRPAGLVSFVTGIWWKGIPYEPTSSAKSGWLETTAAISTGSAPIRERNSRSFRQWPNLLTIRTIRIRSSARWICQSIAKASPTAAKLGPQLVQRHRLLGGEVHPHEEQAGVPVAELLAVLDVAAGHEQIARHGVHDALLVRAGKGEDVLVGHGESRVPQPLGPSDGPARSRHDRSTSRVRGGASGSSASATASRTWASRAARTASGQPWCSI